METVTVFNRKGGSGKTVVSVLMGSYLASAGRKTLVVDLDPQASLTAYFSRMEQFDPTGRPGSYEIMSGGQEGPEAILEVNDHLGIIPASNLLGAIETTATTIALAGYLKNFAKKYDYCVIDTAGNWSTLVQAAFQASSRVIVPTLLSTDDLENALWSYSRAMAYPEMSAKILINQWKGIKQDQESLELFAPDLEGKLYQAMIPQSNLIRRYTDTVEKISTNAKSKQAVAESVQSVIQECFGEKIESHQF